MRTKFLLCIAVMVLLFPGSPILAQSVFSSAAVEQFDGQTWNGLVLGATSTDIKRKFKTGKGAFRPEAMLLTSQKSALPRVEALMDGRGNRSHLIGFWLSYETAPISLSELRARIPESSERYYPPTRYSAWCLEAFPKRGIAAFVVTENQKEQIPLILLCRPEMLEKMTEQMLPAPAPVRDPNSGKRDGLVFEIGAIQYNFNGQSALFSDEATLKRNMTAHISRTRDSGEIRFRAGAPGLCKVEASTQTDEQTRRTTLGVSVTFSGDTDFGPMEVFEATNENWTSPGDGSVNIGGTRDVFDLFRLACNRAEISMMDKVRRLPPPAPEQLRFYSWRRLINEFVR